MLSDGYEHEWRPEPGILGRERLWRRPIGFTVWMITPYVRLIPDGRWTPRPV